MITKPTKEERAAAAAAMAAVEAEFAAIKIADDALTARRSAAWEQRRAAEGLAADIAARDKLLKYPPEVIAALRGPLPDRYDDGTTDTLKRRDLIHVPYYGTPEWTEAGKRMRRLLGVE